MRTRSLAAVAAAVIAASTGACAVDAPAPFASQAPADAQKYDHAFRPSGTPPFAPLSCHLGQVVSVTEVTVTLTMRGSVKDVPLNVQVGDASPVAVTVPDSGAAASTATVQVRDAIGHLVVVSIADHASTDARNHVAIREVRVRGYQVGAAT